MTITETVYTTLAKYHELTTNGVYKHCAGQPGVDQLKTVRNALDRLKKRGRVVSYRDDERGIFLWKTVKAERAPGEIAPGRDASEIDIPDPLRAKLQNSLGTNQSEDTLEMVSHESVTAIPPEHYAEMASDVAEADPILDFLIDELKAKEAAQAPETPASVNPLGFMDILDAFEAEAEYMLDPNLVDLRTFYAGIRFAERHHGIAA